jgi:hypothetical protein
MTNEPSKNPRWRVTTILFRHPTFRALTHPAKVRLHIQWTVAPHTAVFLSPSVDGLPKGPRFPVWRGR